MKKLSSITYDFITNSSTISTLIIIDKNTTRNFVCNKNFIRNMIESKFDEYTKYVLLITEFDNDRVIKEFLNNIKNRIFEYAEILCNILYTKQNRLPDYIKLTIDVEHNNQGLDIRYPEKYVLHFIVKYILTINAINYEENLV